GQFSRFVFVGICANGVLYIAYLAMTWAGVGPKAAMSMLYLLGVLQTFFVNRGWTFRHTGTLAGTFPRYVVTYAVGYALNYSMLFLLVDRWGWHHEWVQAGAAVLVAIFVFILQRKWVFPRRRARFED